MSLIKSLAVIENSKRQGPDGKIVRYLMGAGAVSAAEIARSTGLGKSTVSGAVARLRQAGLVVLGERSYGLGPGRPGTLLSLNPRIGLFAGVVLGPTSVGVALMDVSHAMVDVREEELGPGYSVGDAAVAAHQLIQTICRSAGIARESLMGVGIATPGPINPRSGRVWQLGAPAAPSDAKIGEIFEPLFGVPIHCSSAFGCAALAEITWGAGQGINDFFYYHLDASVGGAIISGGRVALGVAGGAGHVGHMSLNLDGPLCHCGNHGCLEALAGLEAVLGEARQALGEDLGFSQIVARAQSGDLMCLKLITDAATTAGHGLANICAVLNPPVVIVGGQQIAAGELLLKPLRESFERHAPIRSGIGDKCSHTRILPAELLGSGAVARGAIALVLRNQGRLRRKADRRRRQTQTERV